MSRNRKVLSEKSKKSKKPASSSSSESSNDRSYDGTDSVEGTDFLNYFPNALLLGDNKDTITTPNVKPTEKKDKQHTNIWEIIGELNENTETENDTQELADKVCNNCGLTGTLIEDRDCAIVCSDCGSINEEFLDTSPEWKQYSNDDSRGNTVGRCGCPSNFFFPKSSQGTIMAGTINKRLKRKHGWNSMYYKEKSLNSVFDVITKICSANGITTIIVDTAKTMYKKIHDCKHVDGANAGRNIITRGSNRKSIIAACVFRACGMNKAPRTTKEIGIMFDLPERKVTKGIRQFDKLIKDSDEQFLLMDHFYNNATDDYIIRHGPKLRLNKSHLELAIKIANNCSRVKMASDHNPRSIAAGAILLTIEHLGLDIDRKEVAILFGTSDVTISKIYNKISPYSDAFISDEATDFLIEKFKING